MVSLVPSSPSLCESHMFSPHHTEDRLVQDMGECSICLEDMLKGTITHVYMFGWLGLELKYSLLSWYTRL